MRAAPAANSAPGGSGAETVRRGRIGVKSARWRPAPVGEIRYHSTIISFYLPRSVPVTESRSAMDTQQRIKQIVDENPVVLFMKGNAQFPMCGFSGRAVQILQACGVDQFKTVNVLDDDEIRQGIKEFSNWPTIPQLYVNGEFIGGSDIMTEMYQSGELKQLFTPA
jgi:monothiol glutaredoxin